MRRSTSRGTKSRIGLPANVPGASDHGVDLVACETGVIALERFENLAQCGCLTFVHHAGQSSSAE
jgi:hypothetical protein